MGTPEIKGTSPISWISGILADFLERSPHNSLTEGGGEKAWDSFLLGFSRGDDPLYSSFKEHVGSFHFTPEEIFSRTFPQRRVAPAELAVICWVLPQRQITKTENRKERFYPSERWARARIFGERANERLRARLVEALMEAGHEAVAPVLSPLWERKTSERYGLASTWSERHAAFASGLGTFGLCDGLITPVGKAVRIGSVVARLEVAPTDRPYEDPRAYCLFYNGGGICGRCIERCPAGALSERGHDKLRCMEHLWATRDYVQEHYGFKGYGCGLCQTGVPCESGVPTSEDVLNDS